MARTLVWFRGKDLRVGDHAPLAAAIAEGEVIPLFVLDPYFFAPARARELPNRIQFLLESLRALSQNVAHLGSRLVLVAGKSVEVVPRIARALSVDRIVAHRWTEPFGRERDRRVAAASPVPFTLFEGETLSPPGSRRSGAGTPFAVFTPFARALLRDVVIAPPLPAPRALPPLPRDVRLDEVAIPTLAELGLCENPHLQRGGEKAARDRLRAFVRGPAARYADDRNRMDLPGTSRLSADLKFGTLSVRAVWAAVSSEVEEPARRTYLNELLWREFTHHTLWDRPELLREPFRKGFASFPWRVDDAAVAAWREGKTGYPIVDASARQLLGEGFVHNRARMISASFLAKHLMVDWHLGEAHYMKFLTDGDWAQNNSGWQWSAGCGCDAQPYFRVFNPVTQGEKFDPDGAYVRRWVPELAALGAKHIHAPWTAPPAALRAAGVVLGTTYPFPIVDHAEARTRFLTTAGEHLGRDVG